MIEFTNYSDKQALVNLLTQISSYKLTLQEKIAEHSLKCQKNLFQCKKKFSATSCQSQDDFKIKELTETIKQSENAMAEASQKFKDSIALRASLVKDCEEISQYFAESKRNLGRDSRTVKMIKKKIHNKIKKIKKQEKKRKEEERKKREAELALKSLANETSHNSSSVNITNSTSSKISTDEKKPKDSASKEVVKAASKEVDKEASSTPNKTASASATATAPSNPAHSSQKNTTSSEPVANAKKDETKSKAEEKSTKNETAKSTTQATENKGVNRYKSRAQRLFQTKQSLQ